MAQLAERHDYQHADVPPQQPPQSHWSGDVHGPVAALHQAIEERFLGHSDLSPAPFAEPPVEALVRTTSRAAGWLVLAAAFVAAFRLIG